eukprot:CAMPEP_0194290982 /NCGR_PEP_ID=MMETSP0169-20130528/42509_1 /TAXON_ID=218684 /ORGANISM="Corethron pennatum, Strain L29A3" /LENGTH=177 /DNA_ID=CAMNT_0039038737 /DNA_START=72 /DNA_END=605 /DNA_ORIENTATION=-
MPQILSRSSSKRKRSLCRKNQIFIETFSQPQNNIEEHETNHCRPCESYPEYHSFPYDDDDHNIPLHYGNDELFSSYPSAWESSTQCNTITFPQSHIQDVENFDNRMNMSASAARYELGHDLSHELSEYPASSASITSEKSISSADSNSSLLSWGSQSVVADVECNSNGWGYFADVPE